MSPFVDSTLDPAGFYPSTLETAVVSSPTRTASPEQQNWQQNRQLQVPTRNVWDIEFAQLDMPSAVALADSIVHYRRPSYLVTANLNYLMLMREHPRLLEVNRHAAAVIADGSPIVWRSMLGGKRLPCRVAGADLVSELAQLSANRGYRMFFLGGSSGVAEAAADALLKRYPGLQIAGCYSPPFRQLTSAEHDALLQSIRNARTDILLVAFGQPKGEFWIYDHYQELQIPLSIQIGASLDFLAGTARRAPRVWQRLGCEWLYRALTDPRRLVPRYASNLLHLIKLLLHDLLNLNKSRSWPVH